MGVCVSKAETEVVETPQLPVAPAEAPPPQPAGQGGDGWAYRGAPRPANETQRLALLRALGVLDSEQGPDQFDAITRLLCGVFNVPIALVSLVDAERQWFKSVQGLGSCMQTGREESFCAWTLLPDSPHVLIVEDALEDKRFAETPLVVGDPHIRFYAGAPLISSANGYRYGTLCVIDTQPHHEFAAEQYNMLIQFAELCVREIEKDKLTMLQKLVQQSVTLSEGGLTPLASLRSSAEPPPSVGPASSQAAGDRQDAQYQGLNRAADCFREGVVLLDAGTPAWPVLYTNDAFTVASGMPRGEAVAKGFWDLFGAPGLGPATFQEAVDGGEAFTATVGLLATHSRLAVVDFRPAATGQLGGQSHVVGVPSSIDSTTVGQQPAAAAGGSSASKYYFGILRADGRKPVPTSTAASLPPDPIMNASTSAAAATAAGGAGGGAGGSPALSNSVSPAPLSISRAASAAAAEVAAHAAVGQYAAAAGQYNNGRASLDSDRSFGGVPTFKRAMPSAFTDVRLGPLIGRGAYGRVYRGSWNGTTVAVKVIETVDTLEEDAGLTAGKSGIFEAVLSTNLSHPNIVHTYQYAFRPITAEEREERVAGDPFMSAFDAEGPSVAATEVWLISEFCNRGPLLTAIERGAFLTQPSSQYGQPNLISVLQTLQEIAAALQYLHRSDVLHGDLTGGNVLLTASDKDTRGFTAKVVDFGLSRVCSGDYLRTRTLGCAEYMPPELITEGILTKAADVYAFGVITWEMYVGRRAWEGLKATEVLRRVAADTRLAFPPQTPHRLNVLGERCMEYAPSSRPTMEEVLSEVNSILSDTMGILQQFLAASSAAAGGATASHLASSDPFRS